MAHVHLEPGIAAHQFAFLELDDSADIAANRIHQALALATADPRPDGGLVLAAAQLDDLGHFRQFGLDQWRQGIHVFLRFRELDHLAQGGELAGDAIPHFKIGFQKNLVAGERKPALSGLGVGQLIQQGVPAFDGQVGMLPLRRGEGGLVEGVEHDRAAQHDEQNGGRE